MRCEYGGETYEPGEDVPSGDCNSCTCSEDGEVSCTTIACDRCPTIESEYATALDEARQCDPALDVEQCTRAVPVGLVCGCPSFLNPGRAEAIARLSDLAAEHAAAECSAGVVCGACLEPTRALCNAAGRCEDVAP